MFERLSSPSIVQVAVAVAAFVLLLALWIAAIIVWQMRLSVRRRRVDVRLGLAGERDIPSRTLRLWHDGQEAMVNVPGAGPRLSLFGRLDRILREAGWQVPAERLLLMMVGIAAIVFVLSYAWTGYILAGLMAAVAVPLVAWVYLKHAVAKRTVLFENQFLDALSLAARSLRAGHPLTAAFRLISEELPAPVGMLFGRICQQQGFGMDLQEALQLTAAEYDNSELSLFAASVSIQLRTGGNLADLMDRLADVIRDRMRLLRRVRVLTAQTQFSKRVLMILPFVAFAVLNVLTPQYMSPLYSTRGADDAGLGRHHAGDWRVDYEPYSGIALLR